MPDMFIRGASAFANALKRNASLKELRLSSNGITSSGAVSMAQALQNNTSLQVLDLDKNTIDRKGQEELVQVVYNQNKTLYSLLINAHAVGINLRIPTWRQEQEKKTREFGTRILEKRRSALQEKEEEERRRREEEEQKARENTLNLPESFSLERALLELDNLSFVTAVRQVLLVGNRLLWARKAIDLDGFFGKGNDSDI
eukprot:364217-Hanusia_phi.AAC.6